MVQIVDKLKNGFDLDGFDPDSVFQMVPEAGTREFIIDTEGLPCALSFSRQNVALVGNFRNLATKQALPGLDPARFSNTATLPANTKVQFTIKANGSGTTFLSAAGQPDGETISIDRDILISIKPALTRKFAFILVSDLARKTVAGKIEPRFLLPAVQKLFKDQANVDVIEANPNLAFREVHVLKDLGDPINLADNSKTEALDKAVEQSFPDLFKQTDFVVYIVWHVRGKHPKAQTLGMNVQTSTKLNTVYLSLEPPDGAGRTHTMAHEFGHAMGLPHALENCLMFPTTATLNNRLLGGHVEQLHVGPIFPGT